MMYTPYTPPRNEAAAPISKIEATARAPLSQNSGHPSTVSHDGEPDLRDRANLAQTCHEIPAALAITLWLPEPDLVTHQALGKCAEEASELASIVARSMIQGLDACDPKSGKPNRQALAEELADINAASDWLCDFLDLDVAAHNERATRKYRGFVEWQEMLERR